MEYKANPVIVNAFAIIDTKIDDNLNLVLMFSDREDYLPSDEILSRISLIIGDYLVIQEDGYEYLNPKQVFERKYSRIDE